MFNRIKSLFGNLISKDEPKVDVFADDKKATHGVCVGHTVTIEYPILSLYSNLEFELGEKAKKITGISLTNVDGQNTLRSYTEDDYFIQFDYFGSDKLENLTEITLMAYQLDEGDEFHVYTSEELEQFTQEQIDNGVNEHLEKAKKWQQVIDFDKTFEFRGHTYHRFNPTTLGGTEVVELEDDEINVLENNFSVFVREISEDLNEVLFVNAEQGLTVNDDNEIIDRHNTVCVSIALGVTISHSSISVNRYVGK